MPIGKSCRGCVIDNPALTHVRAHARRCKKIQTGKLRLVRGTRFGSTSSKRPQHATVALARSAFGFKDRRELRANSEEQTVLQPIHARTSTRF